MIHLNSIFGLHQHISSDLCKNYHPFMSYHLSKNLDSLAIESIHSDQIIFLDLVSSHDSNISIIFIHQNMERDLLISPDM